MGKTGFQGRKLSEVTDVLEAMVRDPDATILFGYAGSLSTTGQRKLVQWLMKKHYIDVLVPTGANISEDIVEALGFSYQQISHLTDDSELFKRGFNRYYDVAGSESEYLKMTEMIAKFMETLSAERSYSSRELLFEFGKWLDDTDCIVSTAARNGIPVFCPAIVDSPYGDAGLIAASKGHVLNIDGMKDYIEFMSLGQEVRDTAVVYIGGGVPKDFIQLFAVTPDLLYKERRIPNRAGALGREGTSETYHPHKYAVQITTDSPQWGGLSGCTFEEAVSWGKETPSGSFVQCYVDATIALPIVTQALAERTRGFKRKGGNLGAFDFKGAYERLKKAPKPA
jgi:deoxyhypusine synthase